ncbi:MAG: hypothetical protein CVU56_14025 [Deltaproteobacteria bacterium HGW-Deltaproteobacteria-14]|jgi:hypothetical protein|nr:MAG: hypothetical protein CVU56_14025 [Deltaproteobacteria bacterium HGW-Deltaproteobacteria-14]
MQSRTEQRQTSGPSDRQAPETRTSAAPRGGAAGLRGASYADGERALSPEGKGFDAQASAMAPVQLEGDPKAEGGRRENHYLDPAVLTGDKGKETVKNKNWAGKGTLFANGVKATDVIQTNINDCYFVAVLSAIANSQPGYIKSIIREDGPGKYSVRFFEKSKDGASYAQVWIAVDSYLPTTVPAEGEGGEDQIRYGHSNEKDASGKREMWPSIMEKAYAKLKGNYSDIDWGNTTFAYEALFGTQGTKQVTSATDVGQEKVWKQVTEALDAGKPLVASTGSHVITVLRYSEAGGKKITVRDQAATKDGTESGETTYDLAAFNAKFTYVRTAKVDEVARHSEGIHLAGDWDTNYGPLSLVSQSANKFIGTYGGDSPGKLPYAFEGGDSMVGKWQGDDGDEGNFKFDIADKRKAFNGTWGSKGSDSDGGAWTGKRK